MARGKASTRKRKLPAKDKAVPAKLKREDSATTQLRAAINEAKASASKEKKGTYKPDKVLLSLLPKAAIHEDYTCMLNQTNIGHNNNKFYIIQVTQDKKNSFICFTRWGRVGEEGQHNLDSHKKIEDAIKSFKKKFKDKTKNDWDKREDFNPQPGKYTMIEIDEDDDGEEEEEADVVDGGQMVKTTTPTDPCPLDYRTQLMVMIIFSDDMFINQMASMELDIKKMPLGKLSKVQIAKGLEALLDIEAAIKNNESQEVLMDLSSKFYTHCPHNFGRSVPTVLDTEAVVQKKKEVMLTLSDIELTQSLQKEKKESSIHPLLEKYQMLHCELELINKKSDEFKLLKEYSTACKDTRKGALLDIWRIDREGEHERFQTHDDIKNRKLLWHGTNIAVVAAILKAGLRIMPHSGGLVGRGIYFGSEHAQSSWYVRNHPGIFEGEENIGFLFLAEVALGKEKSLTTIDMSITQAPPGFDSVVARGNREPDPKKDKKTVLDGKEVVVPVGNPVNQRQWKNSTYSMSEYLIYKESQARLRYLLKFSFDW